MNFDPEVKKNIKDIAIGSAICALLVFIGFAIFDKVSLPLIAGVVVGYLLAVGNFFFLAVGITIALATGEEAAAKKKMAMSKLIRTVIILAVVAGAILLDTKLGLIKWIPVAAGVFYVRIILAAQSVLEFFKIKKTISTEAASDAPKEYNVIPDEEEEEDGFDKVMSHFAKGPVPGKNNENNKEQ